MRTAPTPLYGVIHGKTIELAEAPGLPDGQKVVVTLRADSTASQEGIVRTAGACADEAEDLDAFLLWNREQRRVDRREIDG